MGGSDVVFGLSLNNVGYVGSLIPTLYAFNTHIFSSAGISRQATGPTLAQVRTAYSSTTWANTYLNMTTQGIQEWTVPQTAIYRIEAGGSAGGADGNASPAEGAIIQADVALEIGEVLNIVVGQMGLPVTSGTLNANGYGGGGGSFVYSGSIGSNGLILAAGGGGGQDDSSTIGASANSTLNPGADSTSGGQTNNGLDGTGGYEDGQGWLGSIGSSQFVGSTKSGTGLGGFGGGGGSQDDGGGAGGFTGGSSTIGGGGGNGGSYYAGLAVSGGYTSTYASKLSNYSFLGTNGFPGYVRVTKL